MRCLVYSAVLALGVVACGGPGSSKTPTTTSDGGADDAALPQHLVSTLPTDVRNPPPFALGSKHTQLHAHTEWAACRNGVAANADVAKSVAALGAACAGVTKMHASGAAMTGSQNATSSAPVVYKFHGAAKHCYRLYGAASPAVKSLVAVVADSTGAEIAEYHTDDVSPYIAPDEAMCFVDDADATITVSVGIGDGPYALAMWSE